MAEVPRMTKSELKNKLDQTEVMVLDSRKQSDFNESNAQIKGAVRVDPSTVDNWMHKYPKDAFLVLY